MNETRLTLALSAVVAAASAAAVLVFVPVPRTADAPAPKLSARLSQATATAAADKTEPAPQQWSAIVTGSITPSEPLASAEPQAAPPVSRLAYVPLRMLHADDGIPSMAEARADASWMADVQREAVAAPVAGPRVASLVAPAATAPLPWQTAAPPPIRDKRLAQRLAELSPGATLRLAQKFTEAKAHWPPAEIALVTVKDEKAMELFVRSAPGGPWQFVHRYPVLAASGHAGPKLTQGDRQVPEGVYGIALLNPDSKYHVSLGVNYPNAFDRQMAARDGRKKLGGDIMIHGKNVSAGCLAIGDAAAEELFVLAAQTGLARIKLVIAPTDFRTAAIPAVEAGKPVWLPKLYADLASTMAEFKKPESPGLLSFFKN